MRIIEKKTDIGLFIYSSMLDPDENDDLAGQWMKASELKCCSLLSGVCLNELV